METRKKGKSKSIFIDALKYIKQTFINAINIMLIIIGGALALFPLIEGGGIGYFILRIALILLSILRMSYAKHNIDIINSNLAIYSFVLLCQFTVLALEMLPDAVMMPFATGPNKWVTKAFSYFSLAPFGYADFFPLLTGVFTVAVTVLCTVSLVRKKPHQSSKMRLLNAVL